MDSEDDIRPLIEDDEETLIRSVQHNLDSQKIYLDPELDEVVYGYRLSRWRRLLVYLASTLLAGLPFLVFHWCPTWLLYLTSLRCPFSAADTVLVVETYQKKCKTSYIHRILQKELEDTRGQLNAAYQEGQGDHKYPIDDDSYAAIHLDDGTRLKTQSYRYFLHKKTALVWEASRAQWAALAGIERGTSCEELHATGSGQVSEGSRARMLNIYGPNEIEVPVQSVLTLIMLEVFNPFYIFQVFTVGVWLAEPYYYYCVAVVLMSAFGVASSVLQTRRNQSNLRATVESRSQVEILVGGRALSVDSSRLAPGDVLLLVSGQRLACDAVLLAGSATINEAMLTGESVPVCKTALPQHDEPYSARAHAAHTLYSGTELIQARGGGGAPATALVIRTGYLTAKGALVRSVLHPVPADFKFDRDSYKFIAGLAVIAAAGLAYTVALKAYRHLSPGDIALKALDILTIVIPPALPAAMTVGRLHAAARLRRARVSVLNTRAVTVSGSIDCVCFDKTGTLTEDGLDMWGVVPCARRADGHPSLAKPQRAPHLLNDLDPLKLGMASCHSLQLHEGQLAGDPLDLKMFESTGWSLEEPLEPGQDKFGAPAPVVLKPRRPTNIDVDDFHVPLELALVQQQQFVSELARASVCTRVLGEDVVRLFCKGAPEVLASLCRPETVPDNLEEVLNSYAELGYRVIAMSTRVLEVTFAELQKMTREQLECQLDFLGLVVMENRLKPASAALIKELKEANIHVVMVTGDNIHTAVSVARECGILEQGARLVTLTAETRGGVPGVYCHSTLRGVPVGSRRLLRREDSEDSGRADSYDDGSGVEAGGGGGGGGGASYQVAMSGAAWALLGARRGRAAARGAVFARMSADQKQQLVVEYQAMGYYVGMVGDGANDCGALRAAHAGVSLSAQESSVAAPFTARGLAGAGAVLRQGRAALATSFGVFKFMIAYSLTEFFSVAFLYYFDSNLTDFQFLYVDIALIVNFAFFFGYTEAFRGKLHRVPPLASLLALSPLLSLIGQLILIMVAQYLSFYAISQFPWYVRHTYEGEEENECYENYAIFAVSMFQYIILAIVFSHGSPYRRSVITNKQLMISILIMTGLCVYIAVAPADWIARFLQLQMPKDVLMAYIVLAIAAIHLLLAIFFERFIIQFLVEERDFKPKFLKERKIRKTPHLMMNRLLTDRDYLDVDDMINFEKETGFTDSSTTSKER